MNGIWTSQQVFHYFGYLTDATAPLIGTINDERKFGNVDFVDVSVDEIHYDLLEEAAKNVWDFFPEATELLGSFGWRITLCHEYSQNSVTCRLNHVSKSGSQTTTILGAMSGDLARATTLLIWKYCAIVLPAQPTVDAPCLRVKRAELLPKRTYYR